MNALHIMLSGAAIIALYYFWTFNYWKRKGIKTLKPNLLFGNLAGVVLRKIPVYEMFKKVYKTCKKNGDKFMGFYFLNIPTLVITDLELVKQILTRDFGYFTDRSFYLNEKDPLTINIVSAKGNQWKKMREQLSPAFSPSKMKNVCQILQQVGNQLTSALDSALAQNHEFINLKDVVSKYVVDAVGMDIFGIECNTLQNSNMEFKTAAENTLGGSAIQHIKLMLSTLCPSVLKFFNICLIDPEIQKFYFNLVKSTVQYREKNNVVRGDLMNSMIQLRNNIDIEKDDKLNLNNVAEENEKSLKIEEITAQAVVFFGAAYETTSALISLCICELALNEDIQRNLKEEIVQVLEKYERKLSYNAIMEMTYLDKCVNETLRKYAVVAMMSRVCTKKYKLPDTDVELDVGNIVYIPYYEIHHDPEYYPNPEEFDPERFSPESKSKRPSFTFLSFGEGQRNCIGSRLGYLQAKIFLVTFLSNYNFNINSKSKFPSKLSKTNMVVSLENPLYLNIQKI